MIQNNMIFRLLKSVNDYMTDLNLKNLEERPVITPDGRGQLIGLDDKENPAQGLVHFASIGKGPGTNKFYDVEELDEVV